MKPHLGLGIALSLGLLTAGSALAGPANHRPLRPHAVVRPPLVVYTPVPVYRPAPVYYMPSPVYYAPRPTRIARYPVHGGGLIRLEWSATYRR